MSGGDFEKERQDFIESSSTNYYPFSWELDGHPAMRRPALRRLRHPWKQTGADWIKSLIVLGSVFGIFFLLLWIAWVFQGS